MLSVSNSIVPGPGKSTDPAAPRQDGVLLAFLLCNVVWTGCIGSKAAAYASRPIAREAEISVSIFSILLSVFVVFVCAFESMFVLETSEDLLQLFYQGGADGELPGGNFFAACLVLEVNLVLSSQLGILDRLRSIASVMRTMTGKATVLYMLMHIAIALIFGTAFYADIPAQPTLYALYSIASALCVAVACVVTCVLWYPELDGKYHERNADFQFSNSFGLGVHLNSGMVLMAMCINSAWFIADPSHIQPILHLVLSKIYVSILAFLLWASTDECEFPGDALDPEAMTAVVS